MDEVTALSSLLAPAAAGGAVLQVLSDDAHVELAFYQHGLLQDSLLLPRPAGGIGKEALADAARRLAAQHREALGAEFVDYYVHIKHAEIERFQAEVSDWEQREYFEMF